jgi:hypothetical protein
MTACQQWLFMAPPAGGWGGVPPAAEPAFNPLHDDFEDGVNEGWTTIITNGTLSGGELTLELSPVFSQYAFAVPSGQGNSLLEGYYIKLTLRRISADSSFWGLLTVADLIDSGLPTIAYFGNNSATPELQDKLRIFDAFYPSHPTIYGTLLTVPNLASGDHTVVLEHEVIPNPSTPADLRVTTWVDGSQVSQYNIIGQTATVLSKTLTGLSLDGAGAPNRWADLVFQPGPRP